MIVLKENQPNQTKNRIDLNAISFIHLNSEIKKDKKRIKRFEFRWPYGNCWALDNFLSNNPICKEETKKGKSICIIL